MNTEDKVFFSFTGIIGFFSEFETIVKAEIVSQNLSFILFQAASVAFVSGFVGLFAKKIAELIYNKIRCKPKN